MRKLNRWMAVVGSMAVLMAGVAGGTDSTQDGRQEADGDHAAFTPSLDTDKRVEIEIAGFMGNFESLDQAENAFNAYYPNVTFSYEQNSWAQLKEYMQNNEYVDIIMTADKNLRFSSADWTEQYVGDYCLDLTKEDLDLSEVDATMVDYCKVDGKLLRVPLAQQICGMIVNKSLLEQQGLEVPTTYREFLDACETLKQAGYTPVQGSPFHVYSELVNNMAMNLLGADETVAKQFNDGDGSSANVLRPAFEKIKDLTDRGYMDLAVNQTYPDDNYDGAILNFFEGDVPFWITNTECVSGMKKRESKSETFLARPFDYDFYGVPLGENGVYVYAEPWYGFSVNKDSEVKDYAVEFLRFLMTQEQLDQFAETKGLPSAAAQTKDTQYTTVLNPAKVEGTFVNTGSVDSGVEGNIADMFNAYGMQQFASVDEAIAGVVKRCSWGK